MDSFADLNTTRLNSKRPYTEFSNDNCIDTTVYTGAYSFLPPSQSYLPFENQQTAAPQPRATTSLWAQEPTLQNNGQVQTQRFTLSQREISGVQLNAYEQGYHRTDPFDFRAYAPSTQHHRPYDSHQTYGHSQAPGIPDIQVCFGMITKVAASCYHSPSSNQSIYTVHLHDAVKFTAIDQSDIKGEVSPDYTWLVQSLLDETSLKLEVIANLTMDPLKLAIKRQARISPRFSIPCSLNITIYGPMSLFEEIGSFCSDNDIYLQDPLGCSTNVSYCNPHRLPPEDGSVLMTADLIKIPLMVVMTDEKDKRPELLDVLNSQQDLAETEQPRCIRTPLASHQKQALTFMLQREHGWAWDGSRPDIWEADEIRQDQFYKNRVSGAHQIEQPPQFYGGIVADSMGLGKTLSMISLIGCDMHLDFGNPESLSAVDSADSSGRTLIVVPPPLLISWVEQLEEHSVPNSLPWRLHHQRSRMKNASDLDDSLIVLTTYQTVTTEWRNANKTRESIIFSTLWKRVVLDEAHFIRNSESQMARAICALNSVSRWAVTGTPIQNRLGDLATLLKFLKVHPYSEKRAFDADISDLWKSGQVEEAVKRLKRLSVCLLLRRPKGTLQLPQRYDTQCAIQLSQEERQLYEEVRHHVINHIDAALHRHSDSSAIPSYVNVLQKIEAMRMICNIGHFYPARHELSNHRKMLEGDWTSMAQSAFDLQRGVGQVQCRLCLQQLDMEESLEPDAAQPPACMFSRCLRFTCSACSGSSSCGHDPPCPVAAVSTDPSMIEEPSSIFPDRLQQGFNMGLPSKVVALLEDLQRQTDDVKSVVFSTWRMTLDVVDAGLKQAGITCLRFDGKVRQKDRQSIIDRFRKDPSVKVLLLTLSCGAVGLTLTVASRAYLMEPSWNPTVEDQALARIHRMGQKREVTTVRFIVQNSFEERVVELQKSKRDLAEVLLNPRVGENGQSESGQRPLEWLRGLI